VIVLQLAECPLVLGHHRHDLFAREELLTEHIERHELALPLEIYGRAERVLNRRPSDVFLGHGPHDRAR
jgi:hypothetical protein